MDPGCSPIDVLRLHRSDEGAHLAFNEWATDSSTLPSPIAPKPRTVLSHDSVWVQCIRHRRRVIDVARNSNLEKQLDANHPRSSDGAFEKRDFLTKR
jgi:hypothetical protein